MLSRGNPGGRCIKSATPSAVITLSERSAAHLCPFLPSTTQMLDTHCPVIHPREQLASEDDVSNVCVSVYFKVDSRPGGERCVCVCVEGGLDGVSRCVGRREVARAAFPQGRSWAFTLMLPAGRSSYPMHPQTLPITAKGSVSHPGPPGHTGRKAPAMSSTAAATASKSGSPGTAGWGRPEGSGRGGLPPPAWPPGSPRTAAPMSGLTGFSPGGLWKSQTAGAGRGR